MSLGCAAVSRLVRDLPATFSQRPPAMEAVFLFFSKGAVSGAGGASGGAGGP
jgi:hypothetical protein